MFASNGINPLCFNSSFLHFDRHLTFIFSFPTKFRSKGLKAEALACYWKTGPRRNLQESKACRRDEAGRGDMDWRVAVGRRRQAVTGGSVVGWCRVSELGTAGLAAGGARHGSSLVQLRGGSSSV